MTGQIKRRKGPLNLQHFRLWSRVDPETGCWVWLRALKHTGYAVVRDGNRTVTAHRRAFELANRVRVSPELDVCHKCDNRACVNPEHLFVGTRKTNMADCSAKDRIRPPNLRGQELPQSKLTPNAVREIRQSTLSQRALARKFGVHRRAISCVLQGKTWRHVK